MPRRPTPPRRRALKRGDRLRAIAGIFAVLVVMALVLGGVLPIVLDFANRGSQDSSAVKTPTPNSSEFEANLRAALAERPDDPQLMVSLANLLVASNRWDEAVEWFERAVTVDPNRVETRLDFGIALARRGATADAEVQLQRAIALDAANADAHLLLGELYLDWQPTRREQAVAEFSAAIAAQPDSVAALRAREYLDQLTGATPAAPATPQ